MGWMAKGRLTMMEATRRPVKENTKGSPKRLLPANATKAWLSEAEAAFDTTADTAQAVGAIRALMFIERFLKDVNQQLDALTP